MKNRRQFIRNTAATTAVLSQLPVVHAAGSDTLKLGLIGCGGRGTGAADNALKADPNVKIVAMGDTFDDRLEKSAERLKHLHKDRFAVDDDHRFLGFDAYRRVLASDVDVVILATPPHFRPEPLAAVVAAGNPASIVEELPELNHLFQTATTGAVSEYDTIEETIAPQVLTRVADWLAEQFTSDAEREKTNLPQ